MLATWYNITCKIAVGRAQRAWRGTKMELTDGEGDATKISQISAEEIDISARKNKYMVDVAHVASTYPFNELNPRRPDKKLLVLDVDGAIYGYRVVGGNRRRPFLDEFLTLAYKDYDIAIWSATNMGSLLRKIKRLGINNHSRYKIAFYMDISAMIEVTTKQCGKIAVKALDVIWSKFPEYSSKNTIIVDDQSYHFEVNPRSGFQIKQYLGTDSKNDRELLRLAEYLQIIAMADDLTLLDHSKWLKFITDDYSHIKRLLTPTLDREKRAKLKEKYFHEKNK